MDTHSTTWTKKQSMKVEDFGSVHIIGRKENWPITNFIPRHVMETFKCRYQALLVVVLLRRQKKIFARNCEFESWKKISGKAHGVQKRNDQSNIFRILHNFLHYWLSEQSTVQHVDDEKRTSSWDLSGSVASENMIQLFNTLHSRLLMFYMGT